MNKLIIIGCGVREDDLTLKMLNELKTADKIFLQTEKLPCKATLISSALQFESLDSCYEQAEDFERLNALIFDTLSREEGKVCYAVYGAGLDDRTAVYARHSALSLDISVELISGISLAQTALSALKGEADAICQSGSDFVPEELTDTQKGRLYYALDNRILVSELKCGLLDYYPPQTVVGFYRAASGCSYSFELHELDRLQEDMYDHTACVYLPPLALEDSLRFSFGQLVTVMQRLRGENGCPWDLEQTHSSLRKALIEEAYEAIDAINEEDPYKLYDELGDVLLQVVFHAQIASEHQDFNISDVTTAVCEKMIRRHPHIFGDVQADTSAEVLNNWDKIKKQEKQIKSLSEMLKDLPRSMPALMRGYKLSQRAKNAFPLDTENAFNRLQNDINSLKTGIIGENAPMSETARELLGGMILLKLCSVLRTADIQPELALNRACDAVIDKIYTLETEKNENTDSVSLENALESVF